MGRFSGSGFGQWPSRLIGGAADAAGDAKFDRCKVRIKSETIGPGLLTAILGRPDSGSNEHHCLHRPSPDQRRSSTARGDAVLVSAKIQATPETPQDRSDSPRRHIASLWGKAWTALPARNDAHLRNHSSSLCWRWRKGRVLASSAFLRQPGALAWAPGLSCFGDLAACSALSLK